MRDPSLGPPRFGVGLTNTIDRLQIHYGDRHTFLYSDRPEGGVTDRDFHSLQRSRRWLMEHWSLNRELRADEDGAYASEGAA